MQTIRYSQSFNCLILERDSGALSYIGPEDFDRLWSLLRHYATVDAQQVPEDNSAIPAVMLEWLTDRWTREGGVVSRADSPIDIDALDLTLEEDQ